MLKLYHGSNVVIDKIDICRSRKGKDFGCGFYLNPDKSQAMDMAIRTYRRSQEGEPTVNTYLFDDNLLLNKNAPLSIKIFEEYSVEWAEFVLMNRKNMTTTPVHHYDIVIGPIANDTVGFRCVVSCRAILIWSECLTSYASTNLQFSISLELKKLLTT